MYIYVPCKFTYFHEKTLRIVGSVVADDRPAVGDENISAPC